MISACNGFFTNSGTSGGNGQINHVCCGNTGIGSDSFLLCGECIPCESLFR